MKIPHHETAVRCRCITALIGDEYSLRVLQSQENFCRIRPTFATLNVDPYFVCALIESIHEISDYSWPRRQDLLLHMNGFPRHFFGLAGNYREMALGYRTSDSWCLFASDRQQNSIRSDVGRSLL